MPSGTYYVTEREKNQSHQNDQSYRNCVITMLIFIFLCVIIIASTWSWKNVHPDSNYVEKYDPRAGRRNGLIPSITELTTEDSENDVSSIVSLSDKESGKFEKYQAIATNNFGPSSTVTPPFQAGEIENTRDGEVPSIAYAKSTVPPTLESILIDHSDSTYSPETDFSSSEITSTTTDTLDNSESTVSQIQNFTSLKGLIVAKYFGNDSTTTDNPSLSTWLDEFVAETGVTRQESILSEEEKDFSVVTTSTIGEPDASTITNSFLQSNYQNENYKVTTDSENVDDTYSSLSDSNFSGMTPTTPDILDNEEKPTTPETQDFTSLKRLLVAKYFGNESSTTEDASNLDWLNALDETTVKKESIVPTIPGTTSTIYSTHSVDTSSDNPLRGGVKFEKLQTSDSTKSICTSGRCKQQSSKMLAWMNHSADPCEDFYEYACGGLEADPEMIILDKETEVFSLVRERMMKEKKEGKSSIIYNYHQSCMKLKEYSEDDIAILLHESLEKIGEFYTADNWPDDPRQITELILNLLRYDRPIVFDITPEINDKDPTKFSLKIGPPLPSAISSIFGVDTCHLGPNEHKFINLDNVYNSYVLCRKNKDKLLKSINTILHSPGYMIFSIDLDLIKELLSIYPPEDEIRESYRSKNYTTIRLGELVESHSKLLNWTRLITNLTGMVMDPDTELQLYFGDNLFRILRKIESLSQRDLLKLNNAILGIYIGYIYNEVSESDFSRNQERNCMSIAAKFLPGETSRLYISSIAKHQLESIKIQVSEIFKELKKTLKLKFELIEWAYGDDRQNLINKLDSIQLLMPQLTHSKENYSDIDADDNFFINSIKLMKKARDTMYNRLHEKPNTPETLWSHFAKAHETQPQTVFALNLILMPFGAVQLSRHPWRGQNFEYSILASIGNLLAHQITHFFDTNGLYDINGSRESSFSFLRDDFTRMNYEEYISCHNERIFSEPIEFMTPRTDQHFKFTIPKKTLNERLSESAGVRLAHETLVRLGVTSAELPPWIDLDIHQLFYLAYAQNFCTKTPLSASTISLYENPRLPSRLSLYAVAVNNRQIGGVFNCLEGSQVLPDYFCDIFPNLKIQNAEIGTA